MKIWSTVVLFIIIGCVHIARYQNEWGKIEQIDFTGTYNNFGIVDRKSEAQGFNAPRLQSFFWHNSEFNADSVQMTQSGKTIEVVATKDNKKVATSSYTLSDGGFVLSRSKSEHGGAYHAVYHFYRTANGIVVESDINSLGVFIIPLAGSDKIWRFYQIISEPSGAIRD